MKNWQKWLWDGILTIISFLIIYSLFVMILGGFFVVTKVTYESIYIFMIYATIFFTIRFVTDMFFNELSKKATEKLRSLPAAVFIQLCISTVLHFIIIYSLSYIVSKMVVPLHIQIILAIGCSLVELSLNGKWKLVKERLEK